MDTGSRAPLVPVTADDHTGYIIFTLYGGLFTTAVFWLVRLVFRFLKLAPRWDDWSLIAAMVSDAKPTLFVDVVFDKHFQVFAVMQTICMQLSASAGLGKQDQILEHGDGWEKVSHREKDRSFHTYISDRHSLLHRF